MKPSSVAHVFRGVWDVQSAYYASAAALCVLSLKAQMTWRIPNEWLVRWLPWLGTALFVVSLLALVNHVAGRDDAPAVGRVRALRLAEWAGRALVWSYIGLGLFVFLNATLDRSAPQELRARVERVAQRQIYVGEFLSYAWTTLRAAGGGQKPMTLFLSAEERPHRWGGEPVRAQRHDGFFRVAWISEIVRDEEALNRAILERLPGAAQPWHMLMKFYFARGDGQQAEAAAQAYLKTYPPGYRDVLSIGTKLFVAGDFRRALPYYRYAFEAHRDYETQNLYGWTLSKLGRHAEAAELLQAAIQLDEAQFWAFYHLGYVYLAMGARAKAAEMFREVLKRRPDFPEVQGQLRRLAQ